MPAPRLSVGMLPCRTCEVAVAEPKSRAPLGDFATALGFHVAQLQQSLSFEHEQAVVRLEREFRDSLEEQQSEVRRLQEQLHCGQTGEPVKGKTLWPPCPEDDVRAHSRPTVQSPLQRKRVQRCSELDTEAATALVRGLPETLRKLADEQDRALKAQFSSHEAHLPSLQEAMVTLGSPVRSGPAQVGAMSVSPPQLHAASPGVGKSPLVDPRLGGVAYWYDETARSGASPDRPIRAASAPAFQATPKLAMDQDDASAYVSVTDAGGVQTLTHTLDYFLFDLLPAWNEGPKSEKSRFRTETSDRKSFVQMLQQSSSSGFISRWTISPNSRFALTWNVLFLLMLLHDMVLFPMSVFDMPKSVFLSTLGWISCVFWTVDLMTSFFVGYFDRRGELVMDRCSIVKHYMRTWLLPDIIFVSTDWLMLMVEQGGAWNLTDVMRAGKAMRCIRILRILRVVRLKKMHAGLYQFEVLMNAPQLALVVRMIGNIVGILLCSHFVGCTWYFIGTIELDLEGYSTWVKRGNFDSTDWYYEYLTAFHWALTQFTPGSMSVQPENPLERSFSIGVLVLGMVIFSSIISSITQVWNNLKNMTTLYDKQLWNLRRYLREQSISTQLVTRVIRYAEHVIKPKLRKMPKEEVQMFSMLPDSLFLDVILEIYDQDLEVHPLFADLILSQRGLMQHLCRDAIQEIMLSQYGDLFGPGQIARHMYFMRDGLLIYNCRHLNERKRVGLEEDEKCIGEAVLWTNWVHQGTCQAEIESTVVALCSKKFVELASRYRSGLWALQAYGRAFVRQMNEQAGNLTIHTNDDVDVSDLFHIDRSVVSTLLSRSWETLPPDGPG